MSVIHAEFAPGFDSGHDAVLLAMDDVGAIDMLAAVTQAAQHGSARLHHGATSHQFLIESGAADVGFHDGTVASTTGAPAGCTGLRASRDRGR
jgi:hypothetical protein